MIIISDQTSRHPREGGGPTPERPVCTTGQVMDSRLRGNDEVWGGRGGSPSRHPELDSGSISPLTPSVSVARWMLKQVQHDDEGEAVQYLFVSSCELK